MPKFNINHDISGTAFIKSIEAVKFRQEGDYFNFYGSGDLKVYTVAAKHVHTIEQADEDK